MYVHRNAHRVKNTVNAMTVQRSAKWERRWGLFEKPESAAYGLHLPLLCLVVGCIQWRRNWENQKNELRGSRLCVNHWWVALVMLDVHQKPLQEEICSVGQPCSNLDLCISLKLLFHCTLIKHSWNISRLIRAPCGYSLSLPACCGGEKEGKQANEKWLLVRWRDICRPKAHASIHQPVGGNCNPMLSMVYWEVSNS